MSRDWFADVLEFERAVGARHRTTPGGLPEKTKLRIKLIAEEYRETVEALLKLHTCGPGIDPKVLGHILAAVADGLADLIFVSLGAAITYGIDLRPVWDAIAAANLEKTTGPRRADGKVLKPPGWQHPDIAAILAAQDPLPCPPDHQSAPSTTEESHALPDAAHAATDADGIPF